MSEALHLCEMFSSIQGEGFLAGRRQIFIRLTDCNLECVYCDTDHSRRPVSRVETVPGSGIFADGEQPMTLHQLLVIADRWIGLAPAAYHSFSLTGGEPLLSAPVLVSWLPALRRLLPVHLETNGTMCLALEQVIDQVDYLSMDIKLPSTSGCTEHLWDLHRQFLTIARSHTGCAVSVKLVVGDATPLEEIAQARAIIAGIDRSIPLFLQPVSLPDGGVGIGATRLLRLQEEASAGLDNVRVIPQMHRMLGVA